MMSIMRSMSSPEGVGGYRRKCAEIAEKGYEGFVFASQGQAGAMHPIAVE
jgi:hypothetical protein